MVAEVTTDGSRQTNRRERERERETEGKSRTYAGRANHITIAEVKCPYGQLSAH